MMLPCPRYNEGRAGHIFFHVKEFQVKFNFKSYWSFALICLVALNFFVRPLYAADGGFREHAEDFCSYKYRIDRGLVEVCSVRELSEDNLIYIYSSFVYSQLYYMEFLREAKGNRVVTGDMPQYPVAPRIFIVSLKDINNAKYFKKGPENRTVVAKFFTNIYWIVLTERVFEPGETDMAHEVAHSINNLYEIKGYFDEQLAQEFESYYLLRTSRERIYSYREELRKRALID